MKILMINDNGTVEGGTEKYILNLKEELENKGHVVKILAGTSNRRNRFSDYEFKCPDNGQIGKLLFYLFNFYAFFETRKVMKLFKPDIVHLHLITRMSPIGLLALRRVPKAITVHDFGLMYPRLKTTFPSLDVCEYSKGACCFKHVGFRLYFEQIRTNILIRMIKGMDILFTNSNFMAEVLERTDVKPLSSLNSIGIRLFKYKHLPNNKKLLFVGRLEKEKGVYYLLHAMNNIIKEFPGTTLRIVGSGSDDEFIKRAIRDLRFEKEIKLITRLKSVRLQRIYEDCEILVVPSLWQEPFGLVGVEAMSVGRPVIASRVGGISEWLTDGKEGLLIKPKESDEISDAVIKLFSSMRLLSSMGRNARKKSELFSIERHVDKIEKLYKKVIDKYEIREAS